MKLEITTKVTHKYLMNKTKSELAYMILDLLDELEKYQEKELHIDARYWDMGDKDEDQLVIYDEKGETLDLTTYNLIKGRLIKSND